jgi:hypothetical protein
MYAALALLCACFGTLLVVLDDFELHEHQRPIPRRELKELITCLKNILARAAGSVLLHSLTWRCAAPR